MNGLIFGEAKMAEIEGRLVGIKHTCFFAWGNHETRKHGDTVKLSAILNRSILYKDQKFCTSGLYKIFIFLSKNL